MKSELTPIQSTQLSNLWLEGQFLGIKFISWFSPLKSQSRTTKNAQDKSSPGPNLTWGLMFFFFLFFSLDSQKDENDLNEEEEILTKMMKVIEQRDRLVDSLEEQRIKEKAEDQHFESFVFSRGCSLSRT
jgi:hypothetical protein